MSGLGVLAPGAAHAAVGPYDLAFFAGNGNFSAGPVVGGAAANAALGVPTGAAVDATGTVYIADPNTRQVYSIDTNGNLTVIAGNGAYGAVIPGPALSSPLGTPTEVDVDAAGTVYITDALNRQVLKLQAGALSVLAGSGVSAAPTPGPALASSLRQPAGVAAGPGGIVYFTDAGSNQVLAVEGGTLSVLAGNGNFGAPAPGPAASSPLRQLAGVAVGPTGIVYIADSGNSQILAVQGGTLSIVAGNGVRGTVVPGAATASPLREPVGIDVDADGIVYFTVQTNYQVLALDAGNLSVVAGTGVFGTIYPGPAAATALRVPQYLAATDTGTLYVATGTDRRVLRLGPSSSSAPVITSGTPTSGTEGQPYSHTFTATGSPAPTWAVSAGALPAGLTLNASTGTLSGTPTTTGSYNATITATNGAGPDATQAINLTIAPALTPQAPAFTAATPPPAQVGTAYSYTVTATGDPSTITYSATGALPAGLTLNPSTGVLSGTPTTAGSYSFTLTASNSINPEASQPVSVVVSPALVAPVFTATTPPAAQVGATYSYAFTATGVPSTLTYSATGTLPPGLTLDASTGVLSGTPTSAGTYNFTLTGSNGVNPDATLPLSLAVASAPAPPAPAPPVAPVQTPGAPIGVSVLGAGTAAVVSFSPPASSGSSAITSYQATATSAATSTAEASSTTVRGAGSPLTIGGLQAGRTYTVTVTATNAAGTGPTSAPALATWAAPQVPVAAGVTRLAGQDRLQTAVAVSQQLFPTSGQATAAVIATSSSYADAIAGGRLASAVGGPLLLTGTESLDDAVAAEARRLIAPGGRIYLLGDTNALSAQVQNSLANLSSAYTITRVGGADRFETATRIADVITTYTSPSTSTSPGAGGTAGGTANAATSSAPIYLASGTNFPDGLAVAALAARTGGVVLLTGDGTLPAATAAYLTAHDPTGQRTITVGGPAAKAYPAAARSLVGNDRYETATLVAAEFDDDATTVGLASGADWPDALVGAAAMGIVGGPLLLTEPDTLTPATGTAIAANANLTSSWVFGGPTSVSTTTTDQVTDILPRP